MQIQQSTYVQLHIDQLEQLYIKHQFWLLTHLQNRLNNQTDAEDLCQKIFLRLCEQPHLLKGIRNHRAWFTITANRHCIDFWRHQNCVKAAQEQLILQEKPPYPSPEKQIIDRQGLEKVHTWLLQLPNKTAGMFIDKRIHELTGKQVAERWDVSLGTVRNHLSVITQLLIATH